MRYIQRSKARIGAGGRIKVGRTEQESVGNKQELEPELQGERRMKRTRNFFIN